MSTWNEYIIAQSVEDALEALSKSKGEAHPIGGGTDLLLDLQQGRCPPLHTLVDITQIPEMSLVEERQAKLFIGAAVPLNQLIASGLVQEHAQALVDAARLIGGPQVRNTATLGGNVAHALPAADGTIAMLALDAIAEIASLQNRRLVPLGDLFLGPGKSALDLRQEILVGFYLPQRLPGTASAFKRVMRPQGVAIAILNLAVWLERSDEVIQDIHISIGPAGPTPLRARLAEAELRGKPPLEKTINMSLEALFSETHFRTSPHRATEAYRRQVASVLLRETLSHAWRRAME
jgi:CO/xanthine dehydrogenase FAD-binding subunit